MELVTGTAAVPADHLDELNAIADETGATIQAFDARYIASRRHLERALELADRAIERGEAIADDRGVEIMLYAAGRRQIERALETGLKADAHPIVVLVDGGDETAAAAAVAELLEPADLEGRLGDPEVLAAYFEVSDTELATGFELEALVLERVALLTIDK